MSSFAGSHVSNYPIGVSLSVFKQTTTGNSPGSYQRRKRELRSQEVKHVFRYSEVNSEGHQHGFDCGMKCSVICLIMQTAINQARLLHSTIYDMIMENALKAQYSFLLVRAIVNLNV